MCQGKNWLKKSLNKFPTQPKANKQSPQRWWWDKFCYTTLSILNWKRMLVLWKEFLFTSCWWTRNTNYESWNKAYWMFFGKVRTSFNMFHTTWNFTLEILWLITRETNFLFIEISGMCRTYLKRSWSKTKSENLFKMLWNIWKELIKSGFFLNFPTPRTKNSFSLQKNLFRNLGIT